ncbi:MULTISPECIES: hypothetical protein [Legionella]|uniref:Uncharacterized protein n=1 Tax=Legionella drozanskii LLAP-1 TaxID=1212489 RepID=A0A0W0T0X7_9GAMM|nr:MULTISPECIES: hypothetical protein [Legionella]KTC89249.1 hypothetical protein Ldro_0738 [Legionella drozanskii LLAP-1]PJE13399.1 MAG: hypothetical protein CK430_06485 [Legionella sp.]
MAFHILPRITLNSDLDSINNYIQEEHASWVKKHAPSFINHEQIKGIQYGILNYPKLWSGTRFFETNIDVNIDEESKNKNNAFEEINKLIKDAKKSHSNQKKEIEEFEKQYKRFFNTLKERCLLKAITKTLESIDGPDLDKVKENFRKTLNYSSLLNMQTRFDCLQAHRDVTLLCYALRDQANPNAQKQIKQLEVLSKRLIDIHYVNAKKMNLLDAIAKDVTTVTSFIGLATGVTAAILALLSFAFPPLALPAVILGFISFVSYTSTIISTIKMAHEAAEYGRGPNPSDVKWLVTDILLAPLNLVGGLIFAKFADLFHSEHVQAIINTVGFVWNNVLSNFVPDAIEAKEVTIDLLEVGSSYTPKGQLKQTKSATSWKKMGSALALHDQEASDKIIAAKKSISTIHGVDGITAKNGRDFAYVRLTNDKAPTDLPITKSYHGHILLWDLGFIGLGTSILAQNIKDAVAAYKELKPDCTVVDRLSKLLIIQSRCTAYLNEFKLVETSKGRYNFVQELSEHVKKEIDNLNKFGHDNDQEAIVLVGFKSR